MAGKGRHYTQEFKNSTIQLALNSEKSAYQIAQDLEMSDKTLYAWLRAYKQKNKLNTNPYQGNKTKSSKETLEEENRRLRKELKDLKIEKDILKKAAAYFAKETL